MDYIYERNPRLGNCNTSKFQLCHSCVNCINNNHFFPSNSFIHWGPFMAENHPVVDLRMLASTIEKQRTSSRLQVQNTYLFRKPKLDPARINFLTTYRTLYLLKKT